MIAVISVGAVIVSLVAIYIQFVPQQGEPSTKSSNTPKSQLDTFSFSRNKAGDNWIFDLTKTTKTDNSTVFQYQTRGKLAFQQFLRAYVKLNKDKLDGFTVPPEERKILSQDYEIGYGEMLTDTVDTILFNLVDRNEFLFECREGKGTRPSLLCRMFDNPKLSANRVFFDLGSGAGKVAIQTFLSGIFKRSVGIEIVPSRFSKSCEALELLSKNPVLFDHVGDGHELVFAKDSFEEIGILQGMSHMFSANTCFDDEMMAKIRNIFDSMPQKIQLASLRPLHPPNYAQLKSYWERHRVVSTPSSWSQTTTCNFNTKQQSSFIKGPSFTEWKDHRLFHSPEWCRLVKKGEKVLF